MRLLGILCAWLGGILFFSLLGTAVLPASRPAANHGGRSVFLTAVKADANRRVIPPPAAARLHPATTAAAAPPPVAAPTPAGVTTGQMIDLRAGAGGSHDRIGRLPAGTAVEILAREADWFLVSLANGATGWLPERGLVLPPGFDWTAVPEFFSRPPIAEILLQVEAVTARHTDIYAGPAVDRPLVTRGVPPGSPMRLSGRDERGMWVSVRDQFGEIGWVLASSLEFAPTFQIMSLPRTTGDPELPRYDWNRLRFEWGGQSHDMRHAAEMKGLGMEWIKVQAKWHPGSRPRDVEGLIRQAHERGFKLLLSIPGEPYPESIDFAAYVAFVGGIAALEPPPDGIEIWNEMNIDFEWPVGEIDPAVYVEQMLKPAYEAIKAADEGILVISGAPAPTGFDNGRNAWADDRYVAGMVQAGAADYLDCVGVHYNGGATSPRAISGHPAGDFYGWYFQPALDMVFRAFGGQKPLCLTEIGYLTDNDFHDRSVPDRFWWAAGTSVENHARWLVEAKQAAADSGFVRLFIIFSMDIYHWDNNDPQTGYAIFRPQGNCPACEALRGHPAPAADR